MNTRRLARAPHVLALLLTIVGLFWTTPAAAQLDFVTLDPSCRQYDSRAGGGGPFDEGTTHNATLTGTPCNVPASATSVDLEVTIIAPSRGQLLVYPAGAPEPSTPPSDPPPIPLGAISFTSGLTTAHVNVQLGDNGQVSFKATYASAGKYHVAIEVQAYYHKEPVAVDDPSYTTEKDTPLNVNAATGVLSNDTLNGASIVSYGATGVEQTTIGAATPTTAGGSVSLNADGSFSYTPPTGAVSIDDTFDYILQNPGGTSQAIVTIGVGKLSQTISFTSTAPTDAKVGGTTYSVAATATSGLPVTFTIDDTATSVCSIVGSTVSFIGAGTCIINANQAGDANYSAAPQVQQSFPVAKGDQTITFTSTAPTDAKVGGPTYNVTATASSGLTVAFTIDASASAVCSISGSTVSFLSVGTCVINANQAGNADWNPAPQVQQSFTVGKGDQTITFTSTAPSDATVNGPTYNVVATASSGLPVTFTIDASATAVCSIVGSTVSFTAAGTCVINANQAGDANYNPAPQAQQSFPVNLASQTINFTSTAPVNAKVGGPTYTVAATATSGLPVTFTIDASASTVCSIAGSTVSFIGVGTCVINANQPGDASYAAAPQEQQSFPVAKGDQTITFTSTAPANAQVGGPTYTVTATATSGLAVTFSIDASASSVCSIVGSTVSFLSVGTCVINANQAGDANWNPAPQAQQSFPVAKGDQTITFTSTAPVNAKVNGPTYTVTATATSGLPVTFSIDASAASVCSIAGSTVSFIGAGTCVINANQAGNANYNPAPQAQQSFPVAKGDQTITFTSTAPSNAKFGGPTYTVTATATSGLAVIFSIDPSAASVCSVAGSTVSFIGAGTCVINANQPGDANWNAAPQVQQSFLVAKADQTITITSTPPALAQIGGPTYTVTANATSGLPVIFTIDASASTVCTIAGSMVSFTGGGDCVINANQPGNANYNPAPQVQQTVPVNFKPVVPDANYVTPGNTQLHVAGATPLPGVASWTDAVGLLAKSGASDPDSRPGSLSVVSASGTSANGGSYSIDGNMFTYVPPVGFAGTDTFPFQVTDTLDITTGTVRIAVGPRVWYIHDVTGPNNPAGGDGRSTNPFDSVAAFNAATTFAGDIIYIFEGNTGTTPHTGSITLKDGQKLWGQAIALNVPGFGTPLVNATNRPRLRTTTASTDVVSVPATGAGQNRQDVEIRGLDLEATGGSIGSGNASNAIDVTSSGSNTVGVTISNNFLRGATGESIDLNAGATSAFSATVQNNTIISTGNGLDTRVSSTGTTTITASTNSITSSAGNAFDARTLAGASALRVALDNQNVAAAGTGILIDGSAAGTTTITSFSGNTVDGTTVGTGISVTSATFDGTAGGAFQLISAGNTSVGGPSGNGVGGAGMVLTNVQGDLTFGILNIFADGGAGLRASSTTAYTGSAGLRLTATGSTAIIEATGGPVVDITQANLSFDLGAIKSTNSPTTGLALNSVTGSFAAASGSSISGITSAAGTAFQVGNSSATVTFPGTITTTQGKGVDLTSNTGGTISLSGALTLSSGTQTAFNASGGGTVTATNTSSTLTSTTGTALNVANTTIGSGGLRFQSISANGAASGIVLNNTGSSGSLTVSGTGTANSGGTIQNTTSHGVSLTNTLSPSFDRMRIQNTARSGVEGTQVTNFTFVNGTIDNSGTGGGADDSNLAFNEQATGTENNLSGTVTITNNTLTNARWHGIMIQNFTGTIADAIITGNTITSSTSAATSLGYGINLQILGSATTVSNLTKATISGNTVTNFPSAGGIQVQGGNSNAAGPAGILGVAGSGTDIISIVSNQVRGQSAANRMATSAILYTVSGKGQGNVNVSSNGTLATPIGNNTGTTIGVGANGNTTLTAMTNNNFVEANHPGTTGDSGISGGVGVTFGVTDVADMTWTINGNTIRNVDGNGILAVARGTNGALKVKIQNNDVEAPQAGVRPGIRVDAGNTTAGTDNDVCLNISGNTSAGSGGSQGIGLRKQGTSTTVHAFGVNGMAATSSPGVETYVNGLNPAGNSTLLISATSGFSNCSLP